MPPAGFEHTIPASEQPLTHALDRAATGIGKINLVDLIVNWLIPVAARSKAARLLRLWVQVPPGA